MCPKALSDEIVIALLWLPGSDNIILYEPSSLTGLDLWDRKRYQEIGTVHRHFFEYMENLSYAGTWGPGYNSMTNIHVKDVANALLMILEAAVAGKADEGAEGFYFIVGDEPNVTLRDIAGTIGDIMFSKGLYSKGGSEPLAPSITDTYGEFFWRVFACNSRAIPQRLKRLGWEATETKKSPLLKALPQQLEVVLQGNHR